MIKLIQIILNFKPFQIIKEKDAKTGDAKEMGKCAEESIDKGAEKAVNFSDEYNRFVTMLKATIDKNKNKRVEYYYRFAYIDSIFFLL